MLSRVADSLYWTSRYFERADNCARVLSATWQLMLNPSRGQSEERWRRALLSAGLPDESENIDIQDAIVRLALDKSIESSVISCVSQARENASQVREEISSEMWQHLNSLYHEVTASPLHGVNGAGPIELLNVVHEGSYKFNGIVEATMTHGEGYQFIQLGKYSERVLAVCRLLDAFYSSRTRATELDWIGLLTSCSAFAAYCKTYTAQLQPMRIAEFLLLHPEFPYSARHAADQISAALDVLIRRLPARNAGKAERIAGKVRSSLQYAHIEELTTGDLNRLLGGIAEQFRSLHAALHEAYIDYAVDEALGY